MGVVPACADCPVIGELGPRDALHTGDRPDDDAFVLQHRALLDVQLEVRVRRGGRARRGAGVADARELVAQARSVVGRTNVERVLHRHATDVDQAAEHVGLEACAFLVGEERHAMGCRW
jgi:hypothetical protein